MKILSTKTWNSLNDRINNLQKANELLLSRVQIMQSGLDGINTEASDIMVIGELTHLLSLCYPVYEEIDYRGEPVEAYEFIIADKQTREIMKAVVQQRATNLLKMPKWIT